MFIGSNWTRFLSSRYFTGIFSVLGVLVLTLLVFSPYIPHNIDIRLGEVATDTVVSPRYIEFESERDRQDTEELRRRRVALVDRVYTVDSIINKQIISETVDVFTELRKLTSDGRSGKKDQSTPLVFLSLRDRRYISELESADLDRIEKTTLQIIGSILSEGVRRHQEESVRTRVVARLQGDQLPPPAADVVVAAATHLIRPNMVFSETLTAKAREKELHTIRPISTELKDGEPIFYKGDVITKDHIQVLTQLDMYGRRISPLKLVGVFLVVSTLWILIERFVYHFNRRIYNQTKYFGLVFFVLLGLILLARGFWDLSLFSERIENYFFIPIPMVAMLISLLVTPNLALLVCTVGSILVALMYFANLKVFLFLFFSACVSTFSIYKRFSRSDLMLSGYVVGGLNIVFVVVLGLLTETTDLFWYFSNMLVAFSTGVISSMITLALVPYIEGVFNITTQQTLLEFSNLNHPLLKRLMMTAPGTYQHSLMVASLAEAAAEAIHADPVLCRVGAYYHDIGKMKRPLFFTENQFSGDNPHSTLTPRMSKMVIASHPRDGVELANKYHLPQVLKDFIMEHHGTTMVSFFYTQALQTEGPNNPDAMKDEFRYPGPKPHFKESGIVMLADSVEAAVRSMEKPTPSKIENVVERIFHDKIEDDQLAECPLSLKEIDIIRETFLRVFKGLYHSRIDYKEELDVILQQGKHKRGSS